jgi:hypothetical protein
VWLPHSYWQYMLLTHIGHSLVVYQLLILTPLRHLELLMHSSHIMMHSTYMEVMEYTVRTNPSSCHLIHCIIEGASSLSGLNDLWAFNTTTMSWTNIVGGTSMDGVYGAINSPSTSYYPSARSAVASCLNSDNSKLYIFGGYNSNNTQTSTAPHD